MSNSNKAIEYKKMKFIFNALSDGWEIRKEEDSYIFTKKHEGKKEVYSNHYLRAFVLKNSETEKILK
tara:strand:- start:234 stop:434 length:201 start_codon:yes stop_codon:yes gene_type:complete